MIFQIQHSGSIKSIEPIGVNAWIAVRVLYFYQGVKIGKGAVVGAGAVRNAVRCELSFSVVVSNPTSKRD
jgi:acetyltransferase-like isoleucine patch superfamily enzyme